MTAPVLAATTDADDAGPPPGDGFDTAVPAPGRWTTEGIAETLPGILPPLRWEVAGRLQDEALRRLLADLGALTADADLDRPIVARIDGRAVLATDTMEAILASVDAHHRSPWRRAAHDLRLVRLRRIAASEGETCIVAADAVVAPEEDLTAWSDEELLVHRWRVLDLAGRTAAAEAAVAMAAAVTYQHLERALVERLGDRDGREWAQRVTSSAITTATSWLRDLAGELRGMMPAERFDALAAAESWSEARSLLAASGAGEELARIEEAARRAGSRAVFAGPSWDEDPALRWPALRRALQEPPPSRQRRQPDPVWRELVAALRGLPGWNRTRVLTGQVIDVRVHLLARLREDAVEMLDRRERTKHALLVLGGEVRRVHLELGRRLAERELLASPADVELLGERDLAAAMGGRSPERDELDRRRRWLAEVGGEKPAVGAGSAGAIETFELEGIAASRGRWSGRARVLRTAEDGDLVEPGDVVVARTTDPSWTPLLQSASALVVEEAGLLSHAAIVARGLGIPAVVGVPGIVDRLGSQELDIEVDGDAGRIVVRPAERDEAAS